VIPLEDDSVFMNDLAADNTFEPSFSDSSLTPPPPEDLRPQPGRKAERRNLLAMLDQTIENDDLPVPIRTHDHPRPTSQPFPLERTDSASGSASTSTSKPDSAGRRFTAQEKGKGRAVIRRPIVVADDDFDINGDDSIQLIVIKSAEKRKRSSSEDAVIVHDARDLGEDEERGLGSFSELFAE